METSLGVGKCLITGATGEIGSRVVALLRERGVAFRLFVRNAEKAQQMFGDSPEIVTGDLGDAEALRRAFDGVSSIFLVNSGPDLADRDALAARVARGMGVQSLVKLSTFDVQQGVGTGPWHARGENAIRDVDIAWTFLQPAGFMNNALAWAPAIRMSGTVRGGTGEGRIAFIHPQDIADVATQVLCARQAQGEALPLTGPVALSYREMVDRIATALGRRLQFRDQSEEEVRSEWLGRGESPESVAYHLSIFRAIREGHLAGVTDTVERVLRRPPRDFAGWVQENLAAFR